MTVLNSSEKIVKSVLLVVSEHLNQAEVQLDDNFYDLGGDSLAAMKIKNELEDQLSIKVSIESIMMSETIKEFADELTVKS